MMKRTLNITHKITYTLVLCVSLLLFSSAHFQDDDSETIAAKRTRFNPVIKILLTKGVSQEFINTLVSDPNTVFDESYIKINVTAPKQPGNQKSNYEDKYNERSVKKNKEFLNENIEIFQAAEDKFNVPKEVICSVLWIETRHGGFLGSNHLATVFLSTAMSNQKEFIDANTQSMKETFEGDADQLNAMIEKVKARAEKKTNWAINELVAMEKITKISPIPVVEIHGSWAGAFGISQFLPSSYLQWAVDGDNDGKINLFELEDAVFSVANYLKVNGWGDSDEDKRKAVFHYNNSNAYVDAVLKLADKIKKNS
jgi:membrane-bound lytic murein transglycosylase B